MEPEGTSIFTAFTSEQQHFQLHSTVCRLLNVAGIAVCIILAVIALALPLLRFNWSCCYHCVGIAVIIALALPVTDEHCSSGSIVTREACLDAGSSAHLSDPVGDACDGPLHAWESWSWEKNLDVSAATPPWKDCLASPSLNPASCGTAGSSLSALCWRCRWRRWAIIQNGDECAIQPNTITLYNFGIKIWVYLYDREGLLSSVVVTCDSVVSITKMKFNSKQQ